MTASTRAAGPSYAPDRRPTTAVVPLCLILNKTNAIIGTIFSTERNASMFSMAAQEVKRRGMSALNDSLAQGPVWVIANNQPKYVVMLSGDYARMEEELTALRVALSESDVRSGRVKRGTAQQLLNDVFGA